MKKLFLLIAISLLSVTAHAGMRIYNTCNVDADGQVEEGLDAGTPVHINISYRIMYTGRTTINATVAMQDGPTHRFSGNGMTYTESNQAGIETNVHSATAGNGVFNLNYPGGPWTFGVISTDDRVINFQGSRLFCADEERIIPDFTFDYSRFKIFLSPIYRARVFVPKMGRLGGAAMSNNH